MIPKRIQLRPPNTEKDCPAYYASDSQYCPRCHMSWDANDPDPPPCKTELEIGNMILDRLKRSLKVPDEMINPEGRKQHGKVHDR